MGWDFSMVAEVVLVEQKGQGFERQLLGCVLPSQQESLKLPQEG